MKKILFIIASATIFLGMSFSANAAVGAKNVAVSVGAHHQKLDAGQNRAISNLNAVKVIQKGKSTKLAPEQIRAINDLNAAHGIDKSETRGGDAQPHVEPVPLAGIITQMGREQSAGSPQ